MSADLAKLYSAQLLGLAADIPHLGRLDAPEASVRERAPLCGSTVSVDIVLTDGKVSAYAQDVKACALGQASAAILGGGIIGCTLADLARARAEMTAFLKDDGPVPSPPFQAFEALTPARAYKNRHASILLAITAATKAAEQAREDNSAPTGEILK